MKLRIALLVSVVILTLTIVQYSMVAKFTQASEVGALAITPTSEAGAIDGEHEHATEVTVQEQIFQVTVAIYLMDNAGLHAMDERINQDGIIEAGDAGVVNRLNRLLGVTAWPEELQTQVDPLSEALSSYAEALANDDVATAKSLATQVHELEHDLSHAAEQWVDGLTGGSGDEHGHEGEHEHTE